MYENTRCFHTSGITLGLGGPVRENAIEMMKKFKEKGALISFDVNFRGNLWTGDEARDCITKILPIVDIFFCSESTANLTFGKTGDIKEILKSFSDEYDIAVVAATQRIVHSPKSHTFGSVIYEKKTDSYYEEKPYEKIEVVDRNRKRRRLYFRFPVWIIKGEWKLPGCAGIWKCSQCYEKYRQWGYVMDRPSGNAADNRDASQYRAGF